MANPTTDMKMSRCIGKMLSCPLTVLFSLDSLMIRAQTIPAKKASIMAVAALDDLVNDLVKASCLHMSPAFLDWIADEATPLVEQSINRSFRNERFVSSLQMGDPHIALGRWVRHWVCPQIVVRFEKLAVYLPEFAESRPANFPAVAVPVPVAAPRLAFC